MTSTRAETNTSILEDATSGVPSSFVEDPNYPSYFPPRDGGVSSLGGFWRNSDVVDVFATELQMAHIEKGEDQKAVFPVFGVASFLARGMLFLVHNHPALDFDGKAVSDGSVVLIPRRIIDTLNNLSFPPSDSGQRAHLLTWMAQATMASAHHVLGVAGGAVDIVPLSTGRLDMSDALPEHLDPKNSLVFHAPSVVFKALKKAYANGASPLAIDELCGQIQPLDDEAVINRTRSRVGDALGRGRIAFDNLVAERFSEEAKLADLAEKKSPYPPLVRRVILSAELVMSHHLALKEMEGGALKLEVEPYLPLDVRALNEHVFFYGSDAAYSIHVHADNMAQDPVVHWKTLSQLIKGYQIPFPAGAIVHITRCGQLNGKDGAKDPGPDFNLADIVNHFAKNSNFSEDTRDTLLEGASSNLWLGAVRQTTQNEIYIRDVVAASLLGKQLRQHARWVFNQKMPIDTFVKAFKMGGDAMCLDEDDGQPLVKTLREFFKKPGGSGGSEDEVAMQHGNVACVRQFLESLTAEQLSRGLLLVACNRHGIDIIPEILAIDGVLADQVDDKGNTVAHLLLDHTDKSKSDALVSVVVKLLDHGLDAHAMVEGYLAGERPLGLGQDDLAGRGVIEQAIVQWQFEHLTKDTPQGSTRARTSRL